MGACCFCACIFKMILGILNMILMVIGIVIAGAGGILIALADSDFVQQIIRVIVVPALEKIYGGNVITGAVTGNFKEMVQPIALALIIIGCILIALAIVGYIGISLSINIFLAIYAVVIGIIVVVQIVLVSLFFSGALNQPIETLMKKSLQDNYKGVNDSNIHSLSWNLMMLSLNCCGAANYKDFEGVKQTAPWPKYEVYKFGNTVVNQTFAFPVVCCKSEGVFPEVAFTDSNCVTLNSTSNNKDAGCRKAIVDQIDAGKKDTLIFYILALIVQVVILVMVCIVMQENKVFPKGD